MNSAIANSTTVVLYHLAQWCGTGLFCVAMIRNNPKDGTTTYHGTEIGSIEDLVLWKEWEVGGLVSVGKLYMYDKIVKNIE